MKCTKFLSHGRALNSLGVCKPSRYLMLSYVFSTDCEQGARTVSTLCA